MKCKEIKVFAGLLLLGLAAGFSTGCSKSNDEEARIVTFSDTLDENSDITCLDEYFSDCNVIICENDETKNIEIIDAIDKLEEKISIYEVLENIEVDEELINSKKEDKEYSLDEVVAMVDLLEDKTITPEERIRIANEIYYTRENSLNWILENASTILEQSSMSVLKCSTLDALELTEESYDKVVISSYSNVEGDTDVKVSNYDVDSKGNAITTNFRYINELSKLRNYLNDIQCGYYDDEEQQVKVACYKKVINSMKKVISSSKIVSSDLYFNKTIKMQKK